LKERESLSRQLEKACRRRERLDPTAADQYSDLNDQVDGLRANINYIQENISECQENIMAMEENKVLCQLPITSFIALVAKLLRFRLLSN